MWSGTALIQLHHQRPRRNHPESAGELPETRNTPKPCRTLFAIHFVFFSKMADIAAYDPANPSGVEQSHLVQG